MFLLDTNVVSVLMRDGSDGRLQSWIDLQPMDLIWTTSITVMEIDLGIERLAAGRR